MKPKTTKQANKAKKRKALAKLYAGLETARAMLSPWAIHRNNKRVY